MRFLRIITPILAILVFVVAVYLEIDNYERRVGPVIEMRDASIETIEASIDTTDEELAALVKAFDDKDGDISANVVVEHKNYFFEKGLSIITFSVCDSDNNVSKISKNIRYVDYTSPKIEVYSDLIYMVSSNERISSYFKVNDVFDGDISSRLKIVSTDFNKNIPGEYSVNCKVTNSFGDTQEMAFPIVIEPQTKVNAKIYLKQYFVYLKTGETHDFAQYIDSVESESDYGYDVHNIKINTEGFDNSKPGVYPIDFTITANNKTVARTRMFAIIEGE